jgi:V/A-type H+-transporting ATPase subunit C
MTGKMQDFTFDQFTSDFSTYAGRYTDVDYTYATGRVRALEAQICDGPGTARLTEVKDIADFSRLTAEAGIAAAENPEKALSLNFSQTCSLLRDLCREKVYLDVFLQEADIHNLKVFLKHLSVFWPDPSTAVSDSSGSESSSSTSTAHTTLPVTSRDASLASVEDMLSSPSSIDPLFLFEAVRDRNPDGIPRWMWQAVSEAYSAYARTGDGYRIDTVLDRACATHAIALAEDLGNVWFTSLLQRRIDLTDFGMLLRARRAGYQREYLATSLLGCGTLRSDDLILLMDQDDESVSAYMSKTPYGPFLEELLSAGGAASAGSAAAYSKASDDYLMEFVRGAKKFSFGPESLVAHRFAKETEIRNFRVVLTFLRNGLRVEEAQPLLRETYA